MPFAGKSPPCRSLAALCFLRSPRAAPRRVVRSAEGRAVPGEPLDVVVFEVHGRQYALPAGQVRELVRAVALVPLPGAPAVVEGVFNLRGKVVPVLDIRGRFGLPPRALDPA